jgi:hypothetical protein
MGPASSPKPAETVGGRQFLDVLKKRPNERAGTVALPDHTRNPDDRRAVTKDGKLVEMATVPAQRNDPVPS